MSKDTSNVTTKGQITIPISIRNELSISPNDTVVFELTGNKIMIEPITKTIKDFFGYKFNKDKKYPKPKDDIENAKRINAEVIANEGLK